MNSQVIRSNLDNRIIHSIFIALVIGNVSVLVESSNYKIENWNDICRIVFELSVKTLIELINMLTVNIQNILLSFIDHPKLFDIIRHLIELIIILIHNDESSKEVSQLLLYFIWVNVSSIENLSSTWRFNVHSHHSSSWWCHVWSWKLLKI